MPGHCQRTKGTEVSSIGESEEREREEHEQDGFFVDVPAEEEGGVAAEGESGGEGAPGWMEKEFYQGGLRIALVYVGETLL